MAASATDYFSKAYQRLTTTLSADKAIAASSMTLNSATNWPTDTGVKASVYNLDANGDIDTATLCVYRGTVSGSNITNLTLVEGTDRLHSAGATVSLLFTATHWNDAMTGVLAEHKNTGVHDETLITSRTEDTSPDPDADFVLTYDTSATALKKVRPNNLSIYAPQGFMQNGKIVTTVATNDLTVAIKTLAGADPSATDPVYVRIGDTVRSITSALSHTLVDGTNWFNSGAAELATQDIDYFAYLGWNATAGVVVLGFSRIPYGRIYSDFSATSTNDKYCAISNITGIAAGNEFENIGRFNATLSAGAGYTWTIPATSVVVSRPIFNTRWLTYVSTPTSITLGNGTIASRYAIYGNTVQTRISFVFGSTSAVSGDVTFKLPATAATYSGTGNITPIGTVKFFDTSASTIFGGDAAMGSTTTVAIRVFGAAGTYINIATLSSTVPMTWATGDELATSIQYELA